METRQSHIPANEEVPDRIQNFLGFLVMLLKEEVSPTIRARKRLRGNESTVYSIERPGLDIPASITTDELAAFLFPNLGEASASHMEALVQRTFENQGCIMLGIPESSLTEDNTHVKNAHGILSAGLAKCVYQIIQNP